MSPASAHLSCLAAQALSFQAGLTEAQTAACIEFIKYMTSEEIANKIISYGIGMAPNTKVNYMTLIDKVDAPEAKASGFCVPAVHGG